MKALVLSGGGSRGSFSVGALKYLIGQGERYDIICGVSVGAINGAFLAQYSDDKEAIKELEHLWLNLETKDIYKRWFPFGKLHALWGKSLYNSKPMRELIERSIDPLKIRDSGKILQIGSVCLDSSLYRPVDHNSENLLSSIKASAALPLLFEPQSVESGTLDVDGGIRENAPIGAAVRLGATHITVICADNLSLKPVDTKNIKSISILKRSVEILADEVINNDVNLFLATNNKVLRCHQYLPEEYHEIALGNKTYIPNIIIKPNNFLVEDSAIFDPKEIREMIYEGYQTAKTVFERHNKK
jgi:NTE family protein